MMQEKNEASYASLFPIYKRIERIIDNFLFKIDREIWDHFKHNKTEVSIFMQRWLKCGFTREFEINITVRLWDATLALDHLILYKQNEDNSRDKIQDIIQGKNKYHSLIMFDYLAVVLLHGARNEILNQDNYSIYQKFLTFTNSKSSEYMISAALNFHKFLIDKKIECRKLKIEEIKNKHDLSCPYLNSYSQTTDIKDKSTHSFISYENLSVLEKIYNKYKNRMNLKDSKDFLTTLIKVKKLLNKK
jgi:isoleucyl-tRNA synthetase